MTGWMVLAAVACLGSGLACLSLAVAGVGDRPAQLTHAVMGLAMAGMMSPWGDPLPSGAGVTVFAVLGAWFVASALRGARDDTVHVAIASAAMVVMYLMHHQTGAADVAMPGPHGGHMMMGGGPTDLLMMPLALLLAGYFVWHTWVCVDRTRCATAAPADGATLVRSRVRVEPVAHGVMSALMAVMFLGVV